MSAADTVSLLMFFLGMAGVYRLWRYEETQGNAEEEIVP